MESISYIKLYNTKSKFSNIGKRLITMINKYEITYELSIEARLNYLEISSRYFNENAKLEISSRYFNEKAKLEISDKKNKNKDILLTISDDNDELPDNIDGDNQIGTGKINIRITDNIWQMFGILIFELINIRNFDKRNMELVENSLNEDEFANIMELIECQSVKDHSKLINKGIKLYFWDEIIRPMYIKNSVCNAKETPHKQAYRDLFNDL